MFFFHFHDPGPLIDGELELVAPDARYIDDVLASCRHPSTVRDAPAESKLTRERLQHFLEFAPGGRQNSDALLGRVPCYHFWMRLNRPDPLRIAGGIGLRIGHGRELEFYVGHLGYHVYPAARGRHYAERACRLLLPLARRHGINPLWITANPDNIASRRTCERLGAELMETVPVPPDHDLYLRGDHEKCRYRLAL